MRASIVRIGNSRGLRVPKTLLEECGIRDAVEISVEKGRLVVQPLPRTREGWAEAALAMAAEGEDKLLDGWTLGEGQEAGGVRPATYASASSSVANIW